MNEKTLVPKLRFRGFDEIWVKEKLGNLVEIKSGKSPKNLLESNGEFPYFKVEQLNNCNKYLSETPYFINDNSLLVKKGSLIFPKRGMAIMANKIRLLVKDSFMDTNLMTLTTKSDKINNEFLFYFLTNEELSRLADTTSVPQLNNKHINPYVIHIPTINEQKKIANFLTVVDKKIGLMEKKHESYLNFKKYLMQQIFAQKLRFDFDDEWKTVKLGELTDKISSGKTNLKKSNDEYGKYPIYGSRGAIGKMNSFDYDNNLILVARVGANAGSLYKINGKCGISDNTLIIKTNESILDDFLFYYLKYYNLNRLIFGSGQPLITGKQLKMLKINLPSIKEQYKISEMFLDLDKSINLSDKYYKSLLNFKKGLLQQMFV